MYTLCTCLSSKKSLVNLLKKNNSIPRVYFLSDDCYNMNKGWMKIWFKRVNKVHKYLSYSTEQSCIRRVDVPSNSGYAIVV